MPSGVYKLQFTDGSFYIGKSISISNRWRQHCDNFTKGVASSSLQIAYYKCGLPTCEAVFMCHKDHIDIAEEMLINRLKPDLNGTCPKDPFQGLGPEKIQEISELLQMSTIEHIDQIRTLSTSSTYVLREIFDRDNRIHDLNNTIKQLATIRTKEEIECDINGTIECLRSENIRLKEQLRRRALPWWKRWST